MAEVINSLGSFVELYGVLLGEFKINKYLRVSWTTKHERSIDQNSLWHKMYQRIEDKKKPKGMAAAKSKAAEIIALGGGIKDCPYKSKPWRSAFLKAVEELQQIEFNFSNE